jgi:hypothetical protein
MKRGVFRSESLERLTRLGIEAKFALGGGHDLNGEPFDTIRQIVTLLAICLKTRS